MSRPKSDDAHMTLADACSWLSQLDALVRYGSIEEVRSAKARYGSVEAARDAEGWPPVGLADVLAEGARPYLWIDADQYPAALCTRATGDGYWAEVLFPSHKETLRVRGDIVIIEGVAAQTGDIAFEHGLSVPSTEIGFLNAQIEAAFNGDDDRPPIRVVDTHSEAFVAARTKWERQEDRVIELLRELGLDPMQLPRWEPGAPGAKAAVWERAKRELRLFTRKSFEKAWERLRAYDRIRYAE